MIERIEQIGLEHDFPAAADSAVSRPAAWQVEGLSEREVPEIQTRPSDRADAGVSETPGRRRPKRGGAEPLVGSVVGKRDASTQIVSTPLDSERVVEDNRQWRT